MKLLLGSNSISHGKGYLEHMEELIKKALGSEPCRVAFVPFALKDHGVYEQTAQKKFEQMGYVLESVHRQSDVGDFLSSVDAIFIGGGNTFRLLNELYTRNLVEAIRHRVQAGATYIGTSAGTNVATLSIKTTNDMPIVYPPSFDALGLVPFNINPHFIDADPNSTHMGETREQRIKEFFEENSNVVVGLREGATLVQEENKLQLFGNSAKVFRPNGDTRSYEEGSDLSFLLA